MCDNLFNVSDALAKQKQNPMNKFFVSCYLKSNKEISVSNESETTNNSKMIVEGDKEKKFKNNNTKNCEDVPEEVSCTKTLSVRSSVKLPKVLPLSIRNQNAITQGIATTVDLNNKKYSNCMLQNKKMYVEKRNIQGS